MKEENVRKKLMLMKESELKKKTDTAFQLRRRLECADSNGICECISCGRKHHYKQMDAGHFIPRSNMATRYRDNNVFSQCKFCNLYKHGNHSEYRKALIKKLGKEEVESMEESKLPSTIWIRSLMIETYIQSKEIIKKLKKEKA